MMTKSGTRLGTQGAAGAVLQEQEAAQGTRSEEPSRVDDGVERRSGRVGLVGAKEQSQVVEGVDR